MPLNPATDKSHSLGIFTTLSFWPPRVGDVVQLATLSDKSGSALNTEAVVIAVKVASRSVTAQSLFDGTIIHAQYGQPVTH